MTKKRKNVSHEGTTVNIVTSKFVELICGQTSIVSEQIPCKILESISTSSYLKFEWKRICENNH